MEMEAEPRVALTGWAQSRVSPLPNDEPLRGLNEGKAVANAARRGLPGAGEAPVAHQRMARGQSETRSRRLVDMPPKPTMTSEKYEGGRTSNARPQEVERGEVILFWGGETYTGIDNRECVPGSMSILPGQTTVP